MSVRSRISQTLYLAAQQATMCFLFVSLGAFCAIAVASDSADADAKIQATVKKGSDNHTRRQDSGAGRPPGAAAPSTPTPEPAWERQGAGEREGAGTGIGANVTSASDNRQKVKRIRVEGNGGPAIRIGAALPLSLDENSDKDKPNDAVSYERAFDMFMDWLAANRGGVRVGGQLRPLEIILMDTRTPLQIRPSFEQMVKDGVQLFFGTSEKTFDIPTGNPYEALPLNSSLVLTPMPHDRMDIERDNVFAIMGKGSSKYDNLIDLLRPNITSLSTIIYETGKSPRGKSCDNVRNYAAKRNITVKHGRLQAYSDSAIKKTIQLLSSDPPDAVIGCGTGDGCSLIVHELKKANFAPKALVLDSCAEEVIQMDKIGELGHFMLGVTRWIQNADTATYTGWSAETFSRQFERLYATHPQHQAAMGWSAIVAFVAAIEAANSTDVHDLKSQLRKMDLKTLGVPVKFDETGHGMASYMVVQVQEDLSMKRVTQEDLVFPMPQWEDRECRKLDADTHSLYGLAGHNLKGGIVTNQSSRSTIECVRCPPGAQSVVTSFNGSRYPQLLTWVTDPGSGMAQVRECEECRLGRYALAMQTRVRCLECVEGRYTSVAGQTLCQVCTPGFHQNESGQTGCKRCAAGKHSADPGAVDCTDCEPGKFASERGQSVCMDCEVGKYSEVAGLAECTPCQSSFATLNAVGFAGERRWVLALGSKNQSACGCKPGTWLPRSITGGLATQCVPCIEHMERCEGAMTSPSQAQGYYIQEETDGVFKAFRCTSRLACPGGDLGSCPKGSSGLVCSVCDQGEYYWDGESCVECNAFQGLTFYVVVILALVAVIAMHWVANDPIREHVASSAALIMLLGLTATVPLCISAIATISITWVEPVKTLLFMSRYFVFDTSFFSLACSLKADPVIDYSVASCLPTMIIFGCSFIGLTRLANWRKLVNTFSTAFYGLYLVIVMHALKPLRFLVHPSGEKSVLSMPYMRPGSDEHMALVAVGIANMIWYCVSFLALCAWATWAICTMEHEKRMNLLVTFRFLFYKFRPETFYWGVSMLARNAFIAVVPSCYPELPHVQLFVLSAVAAASLVATGFAMPWRVTWMNYLDMAMFFVLLLMLVLGALIIPNDNDTSEALATFVVFGFSLTLVAVVVAFVILAVRILLHYDRQAMLMNLKSSDENYEEQLERTLDKWTNEYDKAVADAFDYLDRVSSLAPPELHEALLEMECEVVKIEDIAAIAKRIRKKDYTLRHFHDDIVATFPELSLYGYEEYGFSTGSKSLGVRSLGAASWTSGRTQEEEGLRTIGAFFAVYWLCRLDIDGREGFAFGVDVDKKTVLGVPEDIKKEDLEGLSWPKMTPPQRRAHFYWTFNWSLLQSLVDSGLALPGAKLDTAADGRVVALLALTAFHDIMKIEELCPVVVGSPYGKYAVQTRVNDHDAAIAYVLDRHPETLPSFAALHPEQQRIVRFALSEMDFNAGWLVQAEGPPSSVLGGLKRAIQGASSCEADVIFYFCHWLTDLAGAEPTPFRGSEKLAAKFPPAVLQSLLGCASVVQNLAGRGEADVYEEYLAHRWRQAGTEMGPEPRSIDRIAKLRLQCMAQAGARGVVNALDALVEEDRALLVQELALTGLQSQKYSGCDVHVPDEDFAEPFLLYYGPAWVQRAGVQDPILALRVLAEVFRASRIAWPHREKIFVEVQWKVPFSKNWQNVFEEKTALALQHLSNRERFYVVDNDGRTVGLIWADRGSKPQLERVPEPDKFPLVIRSRDVNPVTRIVRVEILRDVAINELAEKFAMMDSVTKIQSESSKACIFVVDALNDMEGVLKMAEKKPATPRRLKSNGRTKSL